MRIPLMRAVLGAAMLCGIVLAADAPAFKSKAVKYVKINLSGDDAKALVLAYDESQGTDTGYDIIQVIPVGFKCATQTLMPKNANPNAAKAPVNSDYSFVHNMFEPLGLAAMAKAAGVPAPAFDKIMLTYLRQRVPGRSNENYLASSEAYKEGWRCSIQGTMPVGDSQATAPAITIPDKPALKLTARQGKGNDTIELGAVPMYGAMNTSILKNSRVLELTVTVKAKNGDVIKNETGPAGKFMFG